MICWDVAAKHWGSMITCYQTSLGEHPSSAGVACVCLTQCQINSDMVCFSESGIISLITFFFSGEIFIECVYVTDCIFIGVEDILCNLNVYLYNQSNSQCSWRILPKDKLMYQYEMTFNEQQQQKWNEIHQIMDAMWILQ